MKTRIIYLPVPESFKRQFSGTGSAPHPAGAFPINSEIPIPVEIDEDANPETILAGLSMEKIVRAMLRVIEEKQVDQKWIDYYSGFVLFLRPDILEICQEEQNKKNQHQTNENKE